MVATWHAGQRAPLHVTVPPQEEDMHAAQLDPVHSTGRAHLLLGQQRARLHSCLGGRCMSQSLQCMQVAEHDACLRPLHWSWACRSRAESAVQAGCSTSPLAMRWS